MGINFQIILLKLSDNLFSIQSFALLLEPRKLIPSLTPGALFPLRCTAQLVAGLWLVVHSTAGTTSSVVFQGQNGPFQQRRATQTSYSGWSAGLFLRFCLSNRIGREKGWGWGRHPKTDLDAPTAFGGSRSKEEWERTGPVSVRLISDLQPDECSTWMCVLLLPHEYQPGVLQNAPFGFSQEKPWSLLISGKIAYNAISDVELKTHWCF